MAIAVDCRMWNHTGIGIFLRNIVPVLPKFLNTPIKLIGDPIMLGHIGEAGHFDIIPCSARIYSLREQWKIPGSTADIDALWVPHYNAPILSSIPRLVTIHDLCHIRMSSGRLDLLKKLYASFFLTALRNRASISTVSEFTKNELVQLFSYDPDKITVIHNGTSKEWFNTVPAHTREDPYFIYIGNTKPHKNGVRLIKAFNSIADRIPHSLLFAGPADTHFWDQANSLAQGLVKKQRIRFLGKLPFKTLRETTANAVALIYPSMYEGFGLPPLEAMACGCPVLASNAASIPEVCGDAALYFDPLSPDSIADTMMRLVSDDAVRESLIKKGKIQARRFSWDRSAQNTANMLAGLL